MAQKKGKTFQSFLLLPDLDSNQDKQNQNLRYYRYTIGQYTTAKLIKTRAQTSV